MKLAKSNANSTIDRRLDRIAKDLDSLNSKVIQVIALIQQKGFRNFGTIGGMRFHIHKLEKKSQGISLA
ncbi:MAG: hypothetical protein ABJN84_17475 [Flavobacteriaceae bacterium]